MDLWNIKALEPPPVSTCKATAKEIDIRFLDGVLKDGVHFFENQHHVFTEAALLSRSVYRFKMKFRSSKDFKSVEKLNHILHTYQQMEVSNMLKMLLDSIPQTYTVNKTKILTKNMMDYVLVRLQGLGKLLCRIVETCKVVSGFMQQRLRLGHFWKVGIVIFATASRIFVATKNVLKYCCELYGNLLPFSLSLGNYGVQWLPEGYIFPSHLDEWLNIDWLDLENNVIEILDDEPILSYLKLTDSDDEVEFCDEYILVKDDSMICEEAAPCETVDICEDSVIDNNIVEESIEIDDVDIGEVISISDTEAQETPKRRRRSKSAQKSETNIGVIVKTPKSKRKKCTPGNAQKNKIGVGVVIDTEGEGLKSSKRKRKKRASKGLVKNSINQSGISLQQIQKKNHDKHVFVNKKRRTRSVSGGNSPHIGGSIKKMKKKKKLRRFGLTP